MAGLRITADGGVFVDVPQPYDARLVEAARDALTLLFPGQGIQVVVGDAQPVRRPGRATSGPIIRIDQ